MVQRAVARQLPAQIVEPKNGSGSRGQRCMEHFPARYRRFFLVCHAVVNGLPLLVLLPASKIVQIELAQIAFPRIIQLAFDESCVIRFPA